MAGAHLSPAPQKHLLKRAPPALITPADSQLHLPRPIMTRSRNSLGGCSGGGGGGSGVGNEPVVGNGSLLEGERSITSNMERGKDRLLGVRW